LPGAADKDKAGSFDNKAVKTYYEKVQFVTSSGDPVDDLAAAFIFPDKASPLIFHSDANGHSPQTKADSIQTADVHLIWDDFGVPDGADDYERSRKNEQCAHPARENRD
jgi:type VI secretion system secreted protein VgrG